jgi:hypothetical protein
MNESLFTRAGLDSLTTGELVKLADLHGLDIPPGLDRLFIIEELLALAAEDRNEEDEDSPLVMETGFLEPVPLPRQYNITFIEVMIRDPLWVYVFWEVKGFDKEVFEKAPDFGGYYLKVSPYEESRRNPFPSRGAGVFTVPVETDDTARYLGFPPSGDSEDDKDNRFKVELCAKRGAGTVVLAVSSPFSMPSLSGLPAGAGQEERCTKYKNSLIRLSGAGDFHILRNLDRVPRPKKAGNPR